MDLTKADERFVDPDASEQFLVPVLVWPVSFATIIVVSLLTESDGTAINYNPGPAD